MEIWTYRNRETPKMLSVTVQHFSVQGAVELGSITLRDTCEKGEVT
jgi:hypothetical protein